MEEGGIKVNESVDSGVSGTVYLIPGIKYTVPETPSRKFDLVTAADI